MKFGVPCWADDILDALAGRLAGMQGMTADRVFESLAPDDSHLDSPPAAEFLAFRPVSMPVNVGGVTGGGRLVTAFDLRVRIALFSRQGASDQDLRDKRLLRERSRSLLRWQLRLLSRMQMWRPLAEGSADCMLLEPARIEGGFELTPKRPGQGGGGWAVSASVWALPFRSEISQADES